MTLMAGKIKNAWQSAGKRLDIEDEEWSLLELRFLMSVLTKQGCHGMACGCECAGQQKSVLVAAIEQAFE